jgi:predicted kinase
MGTLNQTSPTVILVVGVPGAGKSFFARQFAKTFAVPIVSEDKIRYTLFATHSYSKDENIMVAQVSSLLIDQLFTSGKTFVIDGGYTTKTAREQMARIAAGRGYKTMVIWVQTDLPTAKQRATRRSAKAAGDIYKQSIPADLFANLSKHFTEPTDEKNTVVISGKHNYSAQARVVLNHMTADAPPAPSQTRRSAFIQ